LIDHAKPRFIGSNPNILSKKTAVMARLWPRRTMSDWNFDSKVDWILLAT